MKLSRVLAAGLFAAAFAGTAGMALAQSYPAGEQSYSQPHQGGRGGNRLSPEERAMWMGEHRSEMKSMSKDQRKAYRQQLRQQFSSMSAGDKANMRNALQSRWNALPQQRQQAIEQRLAQKQQGRQGGQTNAGSGRQGYSPQNGQ
jgi:hypothetical protein